MALLGTSWPLLGPIWSQNGSQNGPKSGPKHVQKLGQKMTPKQVKFEQILGPKMSPKIGLNPKTGHRQIWTGVSKTLLDPRCSQDGSK